MLRFMRDYATSWFIKFILGAIVIVFVFWGIGSFRAQRANRVAQVNGDTITLEEYRNAYNNLLEQYRQRFGNQLNEDMIKMLQLDKQALNQLIDQRLLLQEASRLNFRVTDNELIDSIRKIPAFEIDGKFDPRAYRRILSQYQLTPEGFEVQQRASMLISKVRNFVLGTVKVSDGEAREWYRWDKASVDLNYVLFQPEKYEDINPSVEAVESFFDKNKENYRTEPQVKVRYLRFSPESYQSKIVLTDPEIKDYYESNIEEFKTPKTVEARHILIKVEQNASEETVEKAKNKALEVLKKAKSGEDFAELAKRYSEGPSKDSGGYLGTFEKERMVKPFADKAFSMKPGEISELVRTQFGWHIIKVEKVNEASTRTFEEAYPIIKQKLTNERAKNLAYEEALAVSEVSFEGDDLVKNARDRNIDIVTTDFFTKHGPVKGIKAGMKFAAAAFDLGKMQISDVLDLEDGYYILQMVEQIPAKIPDFQEVKEDVTADLIREQQDKKAKDDATALLNDLKNGKDLEAECNQRGLSVSSTGFFQRTESIPEIGLESRIIEAAFKLSEKQRLPDNVIQGTKGYYVITLKARKAPEAQGFEKGKENIKQRLLRQKQIRTFDAFLADIRDRSEILIEDSFQ